jgi:cardiolipin synthase A/B
MQCSEAAVQRTQLESRSDFPAAGAAGSFADQAFTRAAGAPLIRGNRVRLLRDAAENYPAWLDAIAAAQHYVWFESYIIRDDASGRRFAEALVAKARSGVSVRLLYDWLGAVGKTPARFWNALRETGVEVRCFNPFRPSSPLGWIRRDHRKSLVVDGEVGFITGLCVGDDWVGDPARGVAPWRDTGIELHGPVVAEMETAFRRIWALTGAPIPRDERRAHEPTPAGDVAVRIVASEPAQGSLLRVDALVAAAATERLWLTDAYFAGIPSFVEALRSAARDGVDVRLLVPGGSDIPLLRPISQAGYRPLLEAGVRVFEWNGSMLHAKTAVADGRWARVGSTNLNVASWIGNFELDAIIEDKGFAQEMERQYEADLANATELLARERRRVPRPARPARPPRAGGGAGRTAAGALRIGRTVSAAVSNKRVLAPTEARLVATAAMVFAVVAFVAFRWPAAVAWPLAVLSAWLALWLLLRAFRLHREQSRRAGGRP